MAEEALTIIPRIYEILRVFEREATDRAFMARAAFSVADIAALVAIDLLRPAKLEIPKGLRDLARWHAAMKTRASVAA